MAGRWSVSHAAGPDVSSVGSGNEKVYRVFNFGCDLRGFVWRRMFEPQHDIHLRDVTQRKSFTQAIINTAEAFNCGEVLFEIIHKMAQLPADSPLLHLSCTDHFARERALIDCVYVLSSLCDWWSEMCVHHSVDECRVHSVHAAGLGCTQSELCGWSCVKMEFQRNSDSLSVQLNPEKKNKILLTL